jgi:hypothetical protein
MTKYDKFSIRSRQAERPWKIHPVWRGIGCLMMVLIPIISYAGAVLLVQANVAARWLPTPRELAQTITIPYIGRIPYLFANLLVAVVLMLAGFGILTLLYSLMYRVLGPPRYGPLDAPPERYRPRRQR